MVDWSVPVTAAEMYGRWDLTDDEIDAFLDRSRSPSPSTSLYDVVGRLGIGPDHHVLDIGGRDAAHALELAARYGCRLTTVDPSDLNVADATEAIADHPAGGLVTAEAGAIEAIPAPDGSFEAVWARDVLSHIATIDVALAECRRVLAPGGPMIVYQTFATPWLEPAETERLVAGLAVDPDRLSSERFEADVAAAGFTVETVEVVGSQWREAWEEDGSARTSRQLLHAARLIRVERDLVAELGPQLYKVELANALWGIYQMIGKLQPRSYVLRRP